ncbi:MAG: sialate O-acetylesterase [Phycisphaerae bacterium]|jgi:sialate O-acetylesterase
MKKYFCLAVLILLASTVCAAITLPSIISDNMVLQADSTAPIWGKAEPNSKITIACSWNKAAVTVESDEQGKWIAKLKTPEKGENCTITITCGKDSITISNILIGQVWLCSGQSNMEFLTKQSINADKELAEAKFPNIRLFNVTRTTSKEPLDDCNGQWVECSPETAAEFSAVGYFFGKELYKKLKTPIGLINTSFGGSPAQAWTNKEILSKDNRLNTYLENDANNEAHKEIYLKQYAETLNQWKKDVARAVAEGKPAARKPSPPVQLKAHCKCAALYNAMIHPLIPFAIKGVIWYQGESNVDDAVAYRKLFPAMITNWRDEWKQGDFPFYFVQIAAYGQTDLTTPPDSKWAMLREAQTMTLSLTSTGMAVAMDIGEAKNIHPKNKQDVGKRLALWALAKDYGFKDIVYSGPLYKSMKIEGNKVRASFEYADSGLMAKGDSIKGFAIAGADRKFVWANAKIDGNTVLVWSEQIKNPAAVRYGWANWIDCNLYNKEFLPASPFRTDDFPGKTE